MFIRAFLVTCLSQAVFHQNNLNIRLKNIRGLSQIGFLKILEGLSFILFRQELPILLKHSILGSDENR